MTTYLLDASAFSALHPGLGDRRRVGGTAQSPQDANRLRDRRPVAMVYVLGGRGSRDVGWATDRLLPSVVGPARDDWG